MAANALPPNSRPATGASDGSRLTAPGGDTVRSDTNSRKHTNLSICGCSCCMNISNMNEGCAMSRHASHPFSPVANAQGTETITVLGASPLLGVSPPLSASPLHVASPVLGASLRGQHKDLSRGGSASLFHATPVPKSATTLCSLPLLKIQHAAQPSKPPLPVGIPMSRYRTKVEECAELYNRLHEASMELHTTREHMVNTNVEYGKLVDEIDRLRDMLNMMTTELQAMQQRAKGLERENTQLRSELRSKQAAAVGVNRRTDVSFAFPTTAAYGGGVPIRKGGDGPGTLVSPSMAESKTSLRLTSSAAAIRLGNKPLLENRQVHAESATATDGLAAYVRECFRTNVVPHMELLRSLYNGGCLMAVDPPITHAQLSALKRVLVEVGEFTSLSDNNYRLSPCSNSLYSTSPSQSAPWIQRIGLISLCSDNWHTCIGIVLYMIRSLQSVRHLELFSINDAKIMQQLTEALLMASHVEELSLPGLCLTDEGLDVLFSFMKRHELMTGAKINNRVKTVSLLEEKMTCESNRTSPNAAITTNAIIHQSDSPRIHSAGVRSSLDADPNNTPESMVHTLDLSLCTISHPTTLFRSFSGPMLEVLILTGCAGLRDVHVRGILEVCPRLHTVDFSGSEGLTTACITYISQHPRLNVLRLENCPAIKRLDLENIEVLFSSLAYVTRLYAPELRRLPVPITHSQVLFDFYAPKLVEIILKGIVVDRGTLNAFANTTGGGDGDGGTEKLTLSPPLPTSLSANTTISEKPPLEKQQEEEEEKEDGEKERGQTPKLQRDPPQLLSVGFIDCLIASSLEFQLFIKQQSQLLRLSLHGSQGVADVHLARLSPVLTELDLGNVAQLTGSSIEVIVRRLPQLIKLNLKNAGKAIQDEDIHRLHALGCLEVLNLLGLPQLLPGVVSAVAGALRQLRVLYHETAVVETTGPTSVMRVERTDEEDTMRQEIKNCAKELLELRNENALAFWMEARLPKPKELLPARRVPTRCVDLGIPQPPLTANTTFYEITRRMISPHGNCESMSMEEYYMESEGATETPKPESTKMLLCSGNDDKTTLPHPLPPVEENNTDDDDDGSRRSADDVRPSVETAMDERGRLAIEKAPIGPWDEADIVAERRQQSGS